MADEKLKVLKNKRSVIKASVTRFDNYLKKLHGDVDRFALDARKTALEQAWIQYNDVQTEIELLSPDTDHEEERTQFEDQYFKLLGMSKALLADNNAVGPSQKEESSQVRLPKIELPTFSGNYQQWYPYNETFQSLINHNSNISKIQKFHYLKSSLKAEAAEVIASLDMTADNYDAAWKLLTERYDCKRLIVQGHIKDIFDLPSTSKENHIILRKILDGLNNHLRALISLKRPVEHWSDLIVHLVSSKIDSITKKEWESSLDRTTIPSWDQMSKFLTQKCNTLESLSVGNNFQKHLTIKAESKTKHPSSVHTATSQPKNCHLCQQLHHLYACPMFLQKTIQDRINSARSQNICLNCLRSNNHQAFKCPSTNTCKICSKRHNTLLHLENSPKLNLGNSPKPILGNSPKLNESQVLPSTSSEMPNSSNIASSKFPHQVLLSTAVIEVFDNKGHPVKCRALLDSGSQINFITTATVKRLRVKTNNINVPITGICKTSNIVNKSTNINISSIHNKFKTTLKCFVMDEITGQLPTFSFDLSLLKIPQNIILADPSFNVKGDIDILIGASTFWELLCSGQVKLHPSQPIFQKTQLGWIISGPLAHSTCLPIIPKSCNISIREIDEKLERFWALDHIENNKEIFTPEEKLCEEHFIRTHRRNEEGRFIVKLPIKEPGEKALGESYGNALKRYISLEKKLDKNQKLKSQYNSFMEEYFQLGHMKVIHSNNDEEKPNFYLPHHCVIKPSSTTTKVRVVFDASAKTSSGTSLNDILRIGPTLQQDLTSILMRFRTHRYVLTADIEKMYRQVLLDEGQTRLQRILWRPNVLEDIQVYELNTVTYGTASASYLAIRSLRQLANLHSEERPTGSRAILEDFYVDDLLTGASTKDDLQLIATEITFILKQGGFNLQKWGTNIPELISHLGKNVGETVIMNKSNSINTLGLQWNPQSDAFSYIFDSDLPIHKVTKRNILAKTLKIFDPLGLLGPIIVMGKLILQELWQLKLHWDESVPFYIQTKWTQYEQDLSNKENLLIPRLVTCDEPRTIHLHGFCDASEVAYGACIYIRSTDQNGSHAVQLLTSKSRVAPLRKISLPRLELCGAVLLAHLMSKASSSLAIKSNQIHYWTDSKIVLAWIGATSKTWKTFVANRVSEIHELTKQSDWHHIGTKENPADLLSRGASLELLRNSELWWQGPSWLKGNVSTWPVSIPQLPECELLEWRIPPITNMIVTSDPDISDIYNKFSSATKMTRTIAYCLRFMKRCRKQSNEVGNLTLEEVNDAMVLIIKSIQCTAFGEEIHQLKKLQRVHSTSKLLTLNPFLDNKGIVRVGGRLKHANVSYDYKHQILLPAKHHFTTLIIEREHHRQLHAGCQSTLASIRQQFWIIDGRNTVRRVLRKCIECFRAKPANPPEPIMGNMRPERVNPSKPFINCGVDYFGPLIIKEGKRRNSRNTKAYGAIFICLATKAVHIELVSDLSTEAFLCTLRRFLARRGKVLNLYSDNATNFKGAAREIKVLFQERNQESLESFADQEEFQWHFIPPSAPHFGGLWEAAVKSAKYHLVRIVGHAALTFEEMTTVLAQIEAVLNSRPLTPLSSDPSDMHFLTPGHFLMGDTPTSLPHCILLDVSENRLSRWQRVQVMQQHFWRRWSKEYLIHLQERSKWKFNKEDQVVVGQMVVIREDNAPPLCWSIGRIDAVHPGDDGIVRVATVRTAKGCFKRPVTKLSILPIEA